MLKTDLGHDRVYSLDCNKQYSFLFEKKQRTTDVFWIYFDYL